MTIKEDNSVPERILNTYQYLIYYLLNRLY